MRIHSFDDIEIGDTIEFYTKREKYGDEITWVPLKVERIIIFRRKDKDRLVVGSQTAKQLVEFSRELFEELVRDYDVEFRRVEIEGQCEE